MEIDDTFVIEAVDGLPPGIVKSNKQFWDGQNFIPIVVYRIPLEPTNELIKWLESTVGPLGRFTPGRYWDYNESLRYTVMDERVFVWYKLKWSEE